MCGKPAQPDTQVIERIDGIDYTFDKDECAVMFKKLKSVYGTDFCLNFNS
jgi:hypothetical protein